MSCASTVSIVPDNEVGDANSRDENGLTGISGIFMDIRNSRKPVEKVL